MKKIIIASMAFVLLQHFLPVSALTGAEREYSHPLMDLVEAVQGATSLPEDICDNVIIPYHGEYIAPLKQAIAIQVPPEYSFGFVRQLSDGRLLVIARDGMIACFSAHDATLSRVIRPQPYKHVCYAELLDDERLALACENGNLELVALVEEVETQVVSRGHERVNGLVNVPMHHELLLASYCGLVAFDTKTWKKRILKNYAVDNLVMLSPERVVFNDLQKRHGDVCVYNSKDKTIKDTEIPFGRDEMQAACGSQLMRIKDKALYFGIEVYDLDTKGRAGNSLLKFTSPVHAAVGLRDSVAILQRSCQEGPCVTIFDRNGEAVQRLPEKKVDDIFPAPHGGLAMLAVDDEYNRVTHEYDRVTVSVWREQTVQELRKQRSEALQKEREKRKKGFFATAAGWWLKLKN